MVPVVTEPEVVPYTEPPAVLPLTDDAYLKSMKNTKPAGKFIGWTDTKFLLAILPKTLRTNGSATPAQFSPAVPEPPGFVVVASERSCCAWFSSITAMPWRSCPVKPSKRPDFSHLPANWRVFSTTTLWAEPASLKNSCTFAICCFS